MSSKTAKTISVDTSVLSKNDTGGYGIYYTGTYTYTAPNVMSYIEIMREYTQTGSTVTGDEDIRSLLRAYIHI